jgi:hypothetical protein
MTSQVEQRTGNADTGVPIFINKDKFTVAMPVTGAQLRELGHIGGNNQLFLEVPGRGQDELIEPNKSYTLKPGSHLYDLPVGTVGAR